MKLSQSAHCHGMTRMQRPGAVPMGPGASWGPGSLHCDTRNQVCTYELAFAHARLGPYRDIYEPVMLAGLGGS